MEENYIDRIKEIKNEKRMTNDTLSRLTGIPLGTLSKILAGISDSPKLSNIVAICSALGCSVDYILTGIPENTNNYTLEDDEIRFVENYRRLDKHGKEMISLVISKEYERVCETYPIREEKCRVVPIGKDKIIRGTVSKSMPEFSRRQIDLYDMPVSAGTGVYLTDNDSVIISIPDNAQTADADYALRIKGNSMEPKYRDGDILLVCESDSVEYGELGIFILDGDGYFKKYGGDRLISLNPEYQPILLKNFEEVTCCGKVVGKLKRK